ncbi:hypothetical protein ACS0TY_004840 [Phlomoides rotata]
MKRCTQSSIFHRFTISSFRFRLLKSLLPLFPRKSLSTLGSVQHERTKDLDHIDARLYLELFKKCADQCKLKEGQTVHSHFLASRFQHYAHIQIAVINMYAKCGDMEMARKVFDKMTERDSVSYSVLISGYSQSYAFEEALRLYVDLGKMGLQPNRCTFMSALKSAAGMQSDAMGSGIHGTCVKCGCEKNVYVGSALVDMYTRCNRMIEAKVVFDELESKNNVSWNALIAAYARKGEEHSAVKLFLEMRRGSFEPTRSTYASLFAACSSTGALEQGRLVHADMIKFGVQLSVFVGDALLDMYSKAGSIEDAKKVFSRLLKKDVVSWSSMLTTYAHHGLGQEAVEIFEEMCALGFKLDGIAFSCVLKACSHGGLLEKGLYYLELMRDYKLEPESKHYTTIVDLLGRAGQLDRAERFIRAMKIKPTANVWRALLGACRTHKDMELGAYAAERIFELDPHDSGAHIMLSNIYASAGRLSDAARVRKTMRTSGLQKEPACSWVEIGDAVHVFQANDDMHPQRKEIRIMWEKLRGGITKIGYVPDTSDVLWFVDEEEKEERLQCHSEKLALAFALLNTSNGTTILIKKNIRVCDDCHAAFRFVSMLIDRGITLRDTKRFHHFRDGACSCRDYW